ncbi:hypothetical protein A2363_01205 [Candidatus Gottesmanbacteria bacterium RIFOXYB1_FULL_47_11]|uniref:Uncharacterized protein n=1 Tax=Candidatus Gottesmanbacteria bacterium RIFOXYB1_FULL_47_11 TaxID=1798401 RepID=A0A1F6BDT5_9BACT|nr:MAG: hypothetical protein A2363_01205 [Candidatus Gottesmanbacteria bacterium RIFOXYB1_FULL_47_11]
MKAFLYGLLFFVIVAVGAFVYLKYFSPSGTGSQTYKTQSITKTGELRKTTVAGSDFTHMLVAAGESVGVASYTLNLDDYIGKQVEIVGQYSGDTLYADTIQIRE